MPIATIVSGAFGSNGMSLASLVIYLPNAFAYVICGNFLDRYPGMTGFRIVFGIMIGWAVIGLGVSAFYPQEVSESLLEPIFSKQKDSQEAGTISSFQSLCTAVASCVGSGNIVGVSTAVIAGGMGAIFWMWAAPCTTSSMGFTPNGWRCSVPALWCYCTIKIACRAVGPTGYFNLREGYITKKHFLCENDGSCHCGSL